MNTFAESSRLYSPAIARFTDDEMLERLSHLYEEKGWLSGLVIDETEEMPSSSVYRTRFGSLIRAYQKIGYSPARDYRYIEVNRALLDMHPGVVAETISQIQALGGEVRQDPKTDLLRINDEFTASVVIVRCFRTMSGFLRWKIRLDTGLRPDITVAVRMDPENKVARDHYLLPWIDVGQSPQLRLAEDNGLFLDA